MENLSFIGSNTFIYCVKYSFVSVCLFLKKIKVENLSKEITRLELELMNSHSEVLREMQENVRLENSIKNLITSNYKEKQQLNN
ncbi:MAG: hypothetical protein IPL50_04530 [Chitinophagaceae bacterium]|nr:hypothetical protein [Chitinophagaceae bacterium]